MVDQCRWHVGPHRAAQDDLFEAFVQRRAEAPGRGRPARVHVREGGEDPVGMQDRDHLRKQRALLALAERRPGQAADNNVDPVDRALGEGLADGSGIGVDDLDRRVQRGQPLGESRVDLNG